MRAKINFTKLTERAARWVCSHRRQWPWRWLGYAAYLVWRAYENRNFDMATNGEEWCLQQISHLQPQCVFDVGANVGDWLLMCRRYMPDAVIHAFEIAPPVFANLQQRVGNLPRLVLNPFGLSDRTGAIEVYCPESSNYRTTTYKEHLCKAFEAPGTQPSSLQTFTSKVICGDDYVMTHRIQKIDFLKIDVEGMEGAVLRGFQNTLAAHRIRLVQFEYNTTHIVSKFLLYDAYVFFKRVGYRVGKLYPNYVEFRDYHYRHEDFCGPNMIAVHQDDDELIKLLGSPS